MRRATREWVKKAEDDRLGADELAAARCWSVLSPGGAQDGSPRRQPWGCGREMGQPRRGVRILTPLRGWAFDGYRFPRLAPWATVLRPSGAEKCRTYPVRRLSGCRAILGL